jgi:hypothetical protein
MKAIVKRIATGEKGATLVLVLILLLVGGLIIGPLLSYMGTGLITGQVYEMRTDELYAADAGVEDAVWRLQNGDVSLCPGQPNEPPFNISVNDKDVEVTITYVTNTTNTVTYHVESIATGDGSGTVATVSGTKIDAYVTADITYYSMLDHLVTIHEDLDEHEVGLLNNKLQNLGIDCPAGCEELGQCEKCAKAYDYNSDDYKNMPKECKGCIAVYNFPDTGWPTAGDLSARYLQDVAGEPEYGSGTIDLDGVDREEGPLYREGTLEILNGNNKNAASLSLTGTLYITGHTEIGMSGGGSDKPNLTIQLNGETIFVACNYTKADDYALKIGPWCAINGPGAIIAVGDIYLQPNGYVGTNAEPVLVLSVMGTTMIQPNADFLGAIGGKIDVDLHSGHANVDYPGGGFEEINFPSLFEAYRTYSIASWEVIRLSPEDLGE